MKDLVLGSHTTTLFSTPMVLGVLCAEHEIDEESVWHNLFDQRVLGLEILKTLDKVMG